MRAVSAMLPFQARYKRILHRASGRGPWELGQVRKAASVGFPSRICIRGYCNGLQTEDLGYGGKLGKRLP